VVFFVGCAFDAFFLDDADRVLGVVALRESVAALNRFRTPVSGRSAP
jgi:hypothetical protein